MFVLHTNVYIKKLKSKSICKFLINCTDDLYQKWWPGTHFVFHTLKSYSNIIGNIVIFDEYIGKSRIKTKAKIIKYIPEKEIIWQMIKLIKLPIFVRIKLSDTNNGVKIKHSIYAGFKGISSIFDFIFRLFLSKKFVKELDNHVKYEFNKLKDVIV